MLTNATRSKTIDELGVQDKQLCAEIRTHQVAEPMEEESEIAAKKTTEWKKGKLKPENDAARATATSTSINDFPVEGEEEEDRGVQHQRWNRKSRHKPEMKTKLRELYQAVIGLHVLSIGTKSVHRCFGVLSFRLLAEHEVHCVGPGLAEPTSRDPTLACSKNTRTYVQLVCKRKVGSGCEQ
jgi:hypothetical protein